MTNSVSRTDVIKAAAETMNATQKEAAEWLVAYENLIKDIIASESSVRLGIGTFSGVTKETPAKTCRNPRTGESIEVPAKVYHGYPKFKASSAITPVAEIVK